MKAFPSSCLELCRSCPSIRAWSCCKPCWTTRPKTRSSCPVCSPMCPPSSHLPYTDRTSCHKSSSRSAELFGFCVTFTLWMQFVKISHKVLVSHFCLVYVSCAYTFSSSGRVYFNKWWLTWTLNYLVLFLQLLKAVTFEIDQKTKVSFPHWAIFP